MCTPPGVRPRLRSAAKWPLDGRCPPELMPPGRWPAEAPHKSRDRLLPTALAGQSLGTKEAEDRIWLASFMYDELGYFDLEQKPCKSSTIRSAEVATYVLGTICHPSLRAKQAGHWRARRDSNP